MSVMMKQSLCSFCLLPRLPDQGNVGFNIQFWESDWRANHYFCSSLDSSSVWRQGWGSRKIVWYRWCCSRCPGKERERSRRYLHALPPTATATQPKPCSFLSQLEQCWRSQLCFHNSALAWRVESRSGLIWGGACSWKYTIWINESIPQFHACWSVILFRLPGCIALI